MGAACAAEPEAFVPVAAEAPSPDEPPADADTLGWTAGAIDVEGDAERPALLQSVRAGAHPDAAVPHDRVVFEFEGNALPDVHVA